MEAPMSADLLITTVHSATVGVVGRSINQARDQHFVIDSPTLGSALASGEAFLAGVSSCGVTLVERAAQDLGIPVERLDVTINGLRHPEKTNRFARVEMTFAFVGPTEEQAQTLVQRYKDNCPLYGTVADATTVTIAVSTTPTRAEALAR
jgi:uncharacterized OsmC-like protein